MEIKKNLSISGISLKFPFKDQLLPELKSDVIYEYTCICCNAFYIGETQRRATERFHEHHGISHRSGRYLNTPSISYAREHSNNDHRMSLDSFEVIYTA